MGAINVDIDNRRQEKNLYVNIYMYQQMLLYCSYFAYTVRINIVFILICRIYMEETK